MHKLMYTQGRGGSKMGQNPAEFRGTFCRYLSWILTCQSLPSTGLNEGLLLLPPQSPMTPFPPHPACQTCRQEGSSRPGVSPPHWAHPSPLGRSPLEAPSFREARSGVDPARRTSPAGGGGARLRLGNSFISNCGNTHLGPFISNGK